MQDVKDAAQDGYEKVKGNNDSTVPPELSTAEQPGNDTSRDTPLLNSQNNGNVDRKNGNLRKGTCQLTG